MPDLSKYNNDWYNPGKNKLVHILWYFVNILFFINPLVPIVSLKRILLRLFGCKIGKCVVIKPSVNIKYPWLLKIGNNVWIGENVWIDNLANVTLEDNTCISQGAMLLCGNHNYKKSTFDLIVKPIKLKEGSWVGAKAVVCPGVTMEHNSILTVGSIVTSNTEPNGIYQGIPAVKVKTRIEH